MSWYCYYESLHTPCYLNHGTILASTWTLHVQWLTRANELQTQKWPKTKGTENGCEREMLQKPKTHKFKMPATFFLHICFPAVKAFASPSFLWWRRSSVAAMGRLAFAPVSLLQSYSVQLNSCQSWLEIKLTERGVGGNPSVLFFALLPSAGPAVTLRQKCMSAWM